jgi:hypothetical protein
MARNANIAVTVMPSPEGSGTDAGATVKTCEIPYILSVVTGANCIACTQLKFG